MSIGIFTVQVEWPIFVCHACGANFTVGLVYPHRDDIYNEHREKVIKKSGVQAQGTFYCPFCGVKTKKGSETRPVTKKLHGKKQ